MSSSAGSSPALRTQHGAARAGEEAGVDEELHGVTLRHWHAVEALDREPLCSARPHVGDESGDRGPQPLRIGLAQRDTRPSSGEARLDSDAFTVIERAVRKHYDAVTLPTMSTGATDMAYLRAKGIQSYGIGPALDIEDGPKGFGAHSDQERIVESELYRFVRFHWDAVFELARAR